MTIQRKEGEMNKKRATLTFKGKKFEVDELMDVNTRDDGYASYDVFCGTELIGQFESTPNLERYDVIVNAKEVIRDNEREIT